MHRFFAKLTHLLGMAFLILILLSLLGGFLRWILKEGVPDKTILEVNFEKPFIEYLPDDPLSLALLRSKASLRDVLDALDKASRDERVVAMVARVGDTPGSLATIQELRDAVAAFREAGKPAIAYAETFGEMASGNGGYYLATAFGEIHLQPSGALGLTGLLAESVFVRGTLDKLGIIPRLDHRYEYKTAMNMFTEYQFTEAHEEATQAITDSLFGQLVRGIAGQRKLSEEAVRALIDQGPFFGQEALAAGLVDRLSYRDEVYADLKERFPGAKTLYLSEYLKRAGRPHEEGDTIALIYGVGRVERGKSSYDLLLQDISMGSDTVAGAFRAAVKDEEVKAIVFRINSPGGSYVASDTIWREVTRAREAGKPVIVSMGDVAGSGGYFVAVPADKIVAQPATLTGSIGVLAGKPFLAEFWDLLGISWDDVATSEHAAIWSTNHDYSDEEWQRLQVALDRIYADFTDKVTQGRRLSQERVREIARGRVWSGEDAKSRGLVDALGGFSTALRLARQAAGLAEDAPIQLVIYPKVKAPWRRYLEEEPARSEEDLAEIAVLEMLDTLQPLRRLATRLGLLEQGPLTMPALELPQ
jgi:protease-4